MTGIEPESFGIGSDCSANCTPSTDHEANKFLGCTKNNVCYEVSNNIKNHI